MLNAIGVGASAGERKTDWGQVWLQSGIFKGVSRNQEDLPSTEERRTHSASLGRERIFDDFYYPIGDDYEANIHFILEGS